MEKVELTPQDIGLLQQAGYHSNIQSEEPNFFHAEDAAVFLVPRPPIDMPKLRSHTNLLEKRDLFDSSTGGKLLVTEPVNRSLEKDIQNRITNRKLWSEEEYQGIKKALEAGVKELEDQKFAKPDIAAANCYFFQDELTIKVGNLWTCVPATETSIQQTTESLKRLLEHIGTARDHIVESQPQARYRHR